MRRACLALLLVPSLVSARTLEESFAPPAGFTRVEVARGSFAAYLRRLALRPDGTPVRSYRGDLLVAGDDPRLAAVAALDVGKRDLQQCADSIIRLHAEWQWDAGKRDGISYRFVSGDHAPWTRWAAGERPAFDKRGRATWTPRAKPNDSRAAFRAYLDVVFGYAGTLSLDAFGQKVARKDVRPGDFVVLGGSPGHTVLILDMAVAADGRRVALIGQGFMPAQDFHVLRDRSGSVWFSLEGEVLDTPFWKPFPWSSLRRF